MAQTALARKNPDLPILIGGDLQGTQTQHPTSHNTSLAELCNSTSLTHIGDPLTHTYQPSNTPLDH